MKNTRRIMLVGALALLAGAGALLFSVLRMHTGHASLWGPIDPVTEYGYSVAEPGGGRLRWTIRRAFGATSCASDMVSPSNAASTSASGWREAAPPWWTFADEHRRGVVEPPAVGLDVYDSAAGWPWSCLAARWRTVPYTLTDEEARLANVQPGFETKKMQIVYGVRAETMHDGWRSIFFPDSRAWPTRILWPGLLANTALYALVLAAPWMVRAAFIAARAAHRKDRGLCIRCAHSRAGLADEAPCPECGAAAITAPSHPSPRTPTASRRG